MRKALTRCHTAWSRAWSKSWAKPPTGTSAICPWGRSQARPWRGGLAALLLGLASTTQAFEVFPFGTDQALKWGSNTIGTPGGTVTWSLVADGTALDSLAPADLSGTSNLSSVFAQVGGQAAALSMIQQAFSVWSAVANIQFVQVTETGPATALGAATPSTGGVVGDIRISAYTLPGFTGAVGYAAPPNGGTTLEGDIVFNKNNSFGVAPGQEGELYPLFPASNGFNYFNDFQGLFTHELGHALGMNHSGVATALMCGFHPTANPNTVCDYLDNNGVPDGMATINRVPDADDVAGIQFLYGAALVPEPGRLGLMLMGLLAVGWAVQRRRQAQGSALMVRPAQNKK